MSIKELVKTLLEKDSYELLIWLQFLATKMDCRDCIQSCFDKGNIPDCSRCIPASKLIKKSKNTLGKRRQNHGTKI